ncbi:unnamed protein product [Nippostrongylus brasiliensis]|uniref:Cadherin_C domain-containing protein n=1 Tax=Nippostrongylus brasiliensis TaxID=27835 RepID=A0A0N4XML0_NIPBR|nr:unnamed protein product [Nippostrongylus brasiliensis]
MDLTNGPDDNHPRRYESILIDPDSKLEDELLLKEGRCRVFSQPEYTSLPSCPPDKEGWSTEQAQRLGSLAVSPAMGAPPHPPPLFS